MSIQFSLAPALEAALAAATADWQANNKVSRFWAKDPSLWTASGEENWLGWQTVVERQQAAQADFNALAADVKSAGFESAVLLGMGGSSLCPEVLSVTFGPQAGFPNLHIVDSTDPVQVLSVRRKVDLSKAIIIVASKSGSTLEPNVLKQFFFDETSKTLNFKKPGSHFLAITDPGSKMEQVALKDGFRHIFYGDKTIGGRFSALSNFGIIAACVAGLDTGRALAEAAQAVAQSKLAPAENPAVRLGLFMGTAANQGRDKITIFTSPEIYDLGAWMEQLIAESTGKKGKGITPVDREEIQSPEFYSSDRIFAYIRLKGSKDKELDQKVEKIAQAGHPVVTLEIDSLYGIFGQFFLWEVATSVAGSVTGINPFDQPDVESAKIETRALTAAYEETGQLPVRTPFLEDAGVKLYATEAYASKIKGATLTETLRRHLAEIRQGDYFAALAYLPMFPEHEAAVQVLRHNVLKTKKIATCVGFGPRFLHSTGQDYKGGPNQGVFLQITADHAEDAAIPGQKFSFGVVIDAQAAGDFAVLEARGRRALRIHLGSDVSAGLKTLNQAVEAALA